MPIFEGAKRATGADGRGKLRLGLMPQPDGGFNDEAADPVCGCQACKQTKGRREERINTFQTEARSSGAVAPYYQLWSKQVVEAFILGRGSKGPSMAIWLVPDRRA